MHRRGSVRSVGFVACVEKSREMCNFSDHVMHILAYTRSNEVAFVIQPGKTHGHDKMSVCLSTDVGSVNTAGDRDANTILGIVLTSCTRGLSDRPGALIN